MASYTKKIAYNTAAQMIGKVIGTTVAIATVAVLFRYLGVDGVGKYTTVFAFVAFFAVFADFGVQWTLVRELTVNPDKDKVFKNIFTFRLLLALFIHTLAFAFVWFFAYPYDVKISVGVISLSWFFTTINSTLVGVFLNNYRLDISVTGENLSRVVIFVCIWFLTRAEMPFAAVLFAYPIGGVFNYLFNRTMVGRFARVGLGFDFKYWGDIIRQSVPIGLVLVFGYIYFKIDSLMLSLMKGMTDVGIYGTAYKILEVLQTIPSMFLGSAFPLITKYATTGDDKVVPAFQKQFDFLSLLAWPLVAGTFLLAEPIINFISGSRGAEFIGVSTVSFLGQTATSVTCLKLLIFVVGLNFFVTLYSYMIVSLGRQKVMIIPTILFAAINIAINFVLIPHFSYIGAAIATIITEIIVLIIYIKSTVRFITLPIKFKTFRKIIFCTLIMGLSVYFLAKIGVNLFVNIFAAMAVYALAILLTKTISLDILKVKARNDL